MSATQKMIAAGLLLLSWGALVASGMAPVADFVSALKEALIALGVFQATITTFPKE